MKYLEKIITKELLREVLPKETENLSEDFSFYIDEDYIVFRDEGETLFEYNVYKFAFKCKEWAYTQGHILKSEINGCLVCERNTFMGSDTEWFNGISEIETIIKACNWVLEKEIQEENRLQLQEDLTEYNKLIKEGL